MTLVSLVIGAATTFCAFAQPAAPAPVAPSIPPVVATPPPVVPSGINGSQPPAAPPVVPTQPPVKVANFDADSPGTVPDGWKAEATSLYGPAATWSVVADRGAPSPPNALSLTKVNHVSDSTFNLCWTDKVQFKEGWIEAKVRCDGGKSQQCAGVIWRVKDKDNYLLLRLSAMDQNLRLFYVRDGARSEIEARSVRIDGSAWHTLKIQQKGERIVCILDGTALIDLRDSHSQQWGGVGGIGVFTESDATASFDDLRFQMIERLPVLPSPGPELPTPDKKRGESDETKR